MNKRNIYWGLFFTLIGVTLFGSALNLFSLGNSIFTIVLTAVLIAFSISNLPSLNFPGIIMPLIFAVILNQRILGFRGSVWWLIWAGLFLSIGLQMLFKRPKLKQQTFQNGSESFTYSSSSTFDDNDEIIDVDIEIKDETDTESTRSTEEPRESKDERRFYQSFEDAEQFSQEQSDDRVNINATFTDRTRYIRSKNFTNGSLSLDFGNLRVYFDKTTFNQQGASLEVNCNFGQIVLYLPRTINVINNVETTLGSSADQINPYRPGEPTLTIFGDVTLGSLKIIFI